MPSQKKRLNPSWHRNETRLVYPKTARRPAMLMGLKQSVTERYASLSMQIGHNDHGIAYHLLMCNSDHCRHGNGDSDRTT